MCVICESSIGWSPIRFLGKFRVLVSSDKESVKIETTDSIPLVIKVLRIGETWSDPPFFTASEIDDFNDSQLLLLIVRGRRVRGGRLTITFN